LSGAPAVTRSEPDLTYNWGNGAPVVGIDPDHFSARWTRYIYFPSDGVYRFTVTSDDGSRLSIDDELVVDGWYDHTAKTFVVDRTLRSGHHLLRVEYYDNVGPAQVQVAWSPIGQQQPVVTDWRGAYFNNRDLLGDPVWVRNDPAVDFNWGLGSPQPGVVNSDNFSVRWTRTLNLPNAVYRFRATVDDGVRVYVNNRMVINQWRTGPVATFQSGDLRLSGSTNLTVEYFDALDDARIQVVYARVDNPLPVDGWKGEYFNNTDLAGTPALVRTDANVDFAWGLGSPAPGVVNNDDFTVRWTRSLGFQPGNYRFKVSVDDGARLWVNNALIIDQWRQGSPAEYTGDLYLPGGSLPVRLEYVEYKENATIRLTWSLIGGGGSGGGSSSGDEKKPINPKSKWVGEYFNNPDLAGSPTFVRSDSKIDFVWGNGSPRSDINADYFSVRWANTFKLESGLYRFTTETDDGVRLYIDGKLEIDKWRQQPATQYSSEVRLGKGDHTVRMEYQELTDYAMAKLSIVELIDGTAPIGNLVTCVPPQPPNYAWIKLYRLNTAGNWVSMGKGIGSINASGFLKIDGLPIDVNRFGNTGEPYKIEQWIDGRVTQSTGDFKRGDPEFRLRPFVDNATPWGCPR